MDRSEVFDGLGFRPGLLPDQWSTTAWKAFMVQLGAPSPVGPEGNRMSIKSAFAFIQRIRTDDRLRRQLDRSKGLAGVVDLAGREGYRISAEDLRVAFARDAAMRSWFYRDRPEDVPTD